MNNNNSDQKKIGAILSCINVLLKTIVGLLYTPIMLHSLGENEFGVYSLCISFMGYLTLFNAGVNAAYIRFYVQEKVKDGRKVPCLNGIFLKIFTGLSIIAIIFGFIITSQSAFIFGSKITSEEYNIIHRLLIIMTLNSVCMIFNCPFDSMLIANEQFVLEKAVSLIGVILPPIITIPLLYKGCGSVEVAGITLLITFLMLLVNIILCIKKLGVKFDLRVKDSLLFRSIIIFSGFIVIQSIMDQLNWQLNKFLLARFSGSSEITIYTIGSQINSIYITIASAVTVVFIAQINQLAANEKNEEISALFIKISRILCMIVMFIMISYAFFGEVFIKFWAGEGYENSYYVGLLLMLPVTVSLTQGLGQDIMRAKNKHRLQIEINIVVCVLNLLISIPLCKKYGAVGGALGTFIGEVIICIVVQYLYYEKVGKLDMKGYVREMCRLLPAFSIPVGVGILIRAFQLVHSVKTFVAYGTMFTIIYFGSIWILGMNAYEKQLIETSLRKVLRR